MSWQEAEPLDTIKLYLKYIKYISKSWFQYRVDAVLRSFAVFMREATGIFVIYLTLQSFTNINGWTLYELLFLFSVLFVTYGLLILFCTGLRDFGNLVLSGDLDRFLLRPRGVLMQVMASNADMFAAIGHGILGISLFLVCADHVGISWTFNNISYYLITIASGVVIQASIFLLLACSSFWFLKIDEFMNMLYYNSRKFAGYPISIYPKFIQKILMFIVPFAFVNYFPSQYFLRKPDLNQYWTGYVYITPIIALIMLVSMLFFWRFSLKRYSSAGN
ncbi:ABC transporter permease [Paenibacillus odorifer]|nr:ABC transporter permease [Paenibacillus odorifer]